jgi:hypothetical protein
MIDVSKGDTETYLEERFLPLRVDDGQQHEEVLPVARLRKGRHNLCQEVSISNISGRTGRPGMRGRQRQCHLSAYCLDSVRSTVYYKEVFAFYITCNIPILRWAV